MEVLETEILLKHKMSAASNAQREFLSTPELHCTLLDINKPVLSVFSVGVLCCNISSAPLWLVARSTAEESAGSRVELAGRIPPAFRGNGEGCRFIP